MVCSNCGKYYDEDTAFCPFCGAPAPQQASYQQTYQQPCEQPYQQQPYINEMQPEPYQQPYYQQPQQQQPVTGEKPVSIGQYVGWSVLAAIANLLFPIGLVITIVFACLGENKSRANFFRAQLIITAISVLLVILLTVFVVLVLLPLLGVSFSGLGYFFNDLLYELGIY